MAQNDENFGGDPSLSQRDLLPTDVSARRWTWWNYGTLWMGMVHSLYNFTWMGGLLLLGMSVWQAMAVALVGNLIQTVLIGINGRVGARYGIPFPVWARSAFGVYGANIPALIRGLVAIGWFGVQSFLGATAINVLLSATIGPWKDLGHASILGAPLNLFIAMVLYWAINLLVINHGMETVRRFESWAGPMIFVVMVVLVIWAVSSAHGFGPMFAMHSKYSTGAFLGKEFVPMVAIYVSGSWATMVLNIPDLTRFATSNRGQFWGTMIGLPLATFVFYAMAGIVVSATDVIYGKIIWNPSDILMAIGVPALTIVGAILLGIATISVNIPANIVSPAYDLTNLFSKRLNFKRSAIIAIIISFVYMPWRLMQNPTILYGLLNNVGALLGPITGIIIADYMVVRQQRIDVHELYRAFGRYRSKGGFNIAALVTVAVVSGIIFLGEFDKRVGWLYNYAWFVGLIVGFLGYLAVLAVWKSRKRELPPEFQPAGDRGVEFIELEDRTGTNASV